MARHLQDRIVGLVLLTFAVAWVVIVYRTIPTLAGEGEYGPRDFPMVFGIALAVCSLLMIAGSFSRDAGADAGTEAGDTSAGVDRKEVLGVAWTFLSILIYGFAMEKVGFLVATPLLVTAILYFLLRVRSVAFLAAFAIGLTVGTYIIFNKFLGAYLPPGTWFTLI